MTTGDNYSRYRGGEGQSGQTKRILAQEVLRMISQAGTTTARTEKDVMTKIAALDATFRNASDWLAATGQGITDQPSLRGAVLQRCPQYFLLLDIMQDRPSTRPQLLNTDQEAKESDTDDDSCTDEESKSNSTSTSIQSATTSITSTTTSRPLSIAQPPNKKPRKGDYNPHSDLARVKEAQLKQQRELKLMELTVQKQQVDLQEQEINNRRMQIENEKQVFNARIQESNAQSTELLQEAEHWRLQRKIALLRERNKLFQEGVSKQEIDLLLPLDTDL